MNGRPITRRSTLAGLAAASVSVPLAGIGASNSQSAFPKGFLWGAATAGHQVEGNNVASDSWLLEHLPATIYAEPSGDACDHYHRYPEDIAMVADLGLNTYRFSLEWARIEPEPGAFSRAQLEHYRRMIGACRDRGLTPMVTYNHFINPRWFAARGGWQVKDAGDYFVRYCERVTAALGDVLVIVTTFNEPNVGKQIRWGEKGPDPRRTAMLKQAAQACGSEQFFNHTAGDLARSQEIQIDAHRRAVAAIKAGPGTFSVGLSIAISDEQGVGPSNGAAAKRAYLYDGWLEAARADDFIGVQTYTRTLVGANGDLPVPSGAPTSQLGQETYVPALGNTIRYAAQRAKVPVYVTENGLATEDDAARLAYIEQIIPTLRTVLAEGIDLRGYIHWSLMDNYEWVFGYRPKFGLVAVDRATQQRTIKPSGRRFGEIARRNGNLS